MKKALSGVAVLLFLVVGAISVAFLAGALAGARPAGATLPGANGKIAFASDRDGNYEIYAMNANGSGQTRLTNNKAHDGFPAWSPDGTKMAFHSNRDNTDYFNFDIYAMNADGTSVTRLTNNAAEDCCPAWSPDGTKIAFTSDRDGRYNYEIYVMNADGTGVIRLTDSLGWDVWPDWSPDGSKIAFTSSRDANLEIYVMNADGSAQTRLTYNDSGNDGRPSWSPDGTKIAFERVQFGTYNYEVYVMNADGSGQTNLTNNPAIDYFAAWSPDGTKIAFVRASGYRSQVYVMNAADGSGRSRLTTRGENWAPDWQRLLP